MNMNRNLAPTFNSHNSNSNSMDTKMKKFGDIEEIEDEVERQFNRFKNFDVVYYDPYDHYYSNQTDHFFAKFITGQRFKQTMEEEWRSLEESIPSSIFVRAYSGRKDLMRAAFTGPPGSVYGHSLFFFDIFFPLNYPTVPPMIRYLSCGNGIDSISVKPDGKVDIDVSETWYDRIKQRLSCGGGEKKWSVKEFNVLDVLSGIYKVISDFSYRPISKEYKRSAFVGACEEMIRVIGKPPIGFEFFVAGHFRRRANAVMLEFKRNEYYNDNAMIDLFIVMFTVFEKNGCYCRHHLDFLKKKEKIAMEEVVKKMRMVKVYEEISNI